MQQDLQQLYRMRGKGRILREFPQAEITFKSLPRDARWTLAAMIRTADAAGLSAIAEGLHHAEQSRLTQEPGVLTARLAPDDERTVYVYDLICPCGISGMCPHLIAGMARTWQLGRSPFSNIG